MQAFTVVADLDREDARHAELCLDHLGRFHSVITRTHPDEPGLTLIMAAHDAQEARRRGLALLKAVGYRFADVEVRQCEALDV